jgi:hypothetical protein
MGYKHDAKAMDWFIHNDGCWVAYGHDGQKYEVGEVGGGDYELNICGLVRITCDSSKYGKKLADSWDWASQLDIFGVM